MPDALSSWALMKMPCSEDLLTRCLSEYWDDKHTTSSLRSRSRMRGVIQLLAHEVRTWAPDKGQAKICHLAINEVADRLVHEANHAH